MAASFPMAAPSWCSRDYCRPSIRLAALMGIRVIFVMTHDSIGVGEDGPTHQPVEHLAALRAIPGLLVMRPADGVETAECWELALKNDGRPSLIAFSRQDVPTRAPDPHQRKSVAPGAPMNWPATRTPRSPSWPPARKSSLAMEARASAGRRRHRRARGLHALLGLVRGTAARISQKDSGARHRQGRHRGRRARRLGPLYRLGPSGGRRRLHRHASFGASGPYKDVYWHFGITADAAVAAARKLLK